MIPIVELSPGVAGGCASLQEAVEAGAAKRIDNAELVQQKKGTILVVGDREFSLNLLWSLKGAGYEVFHASNVFEARQIMETHDFDIIISAASIKQDLDGIWLAQNRKNNVPFIIASSGRLSADELPRLNAEGANINCILTNPTPDTLVSKINEILVQKGRLEGKKVLAVVNDSTLRKALGTMLQWEDAQVTTASNPEEVLLHHQPLSQFDLILCDGITGTDISGREFLTGAHESAPNSKLALMAYSPDGKIDLTGTPINTFLLKPIGDKSIDTIVEILKLPVT